MDISVVTQKMTLVEIVHEFLKPDDENGSRDKKEVAEKMRRD